MGQFSQSISPSNQIDPLNIAVAFLTSHRHEDYYVYEREDTWYIGLRAFSSLLIDPDGQEATIFSPDGTKFSSVIENGTSLNDIARAFTSEYVHHDRIFGYAGFNYSAHVAGQVYIPGQWPLLSLMVPRIQIALSRDSIVVSGCQEREVNATFHYVQGCSTSGSVIAVFDDFLPINLQCNSHEYKERVSKAVLEIKKGRFSKVIPSRVVNLPTRVDMLATLFHGRRANTPARTFAFNHRGYQATGFSPEIVLSVQRSFVYTDALAGTQVCGATTTRLDKKYKLHNDPKEVLEHTIAVKGAIRRLRHICSPDSVVVQEFMTTAIRGNIRHLHSRITGCKLPCKDGWDSIRSNITVPALPKHQNLEAITVFEPLPRELYCGSVLMIDGAGFFEATLVLRTVFQDQHRQWLQAGAGITALSNPDREFQETCEKLESIAPYVVTDSNPSCSETSHGSRRNT